MRHKHTPFVKGTDQAHRSVVHNQCTARKPSKRAREPDQDIPLFFEQQLSVFFFYHKVIDALQRLVDRSLHSINSQLYGSISKRSKNEFLSQKHDRFHRGLAPR